jgi:hypothetical protein
MVLNDKVVCATAVSIIHIVYNEPGPSWRPKKLVLLKAVYL